MPTIEELEQQLVELRAKLAELEAADADAGQAGQQLRAEWRRYGLRADLDDDAAAAERANELQQQLQNAGLADERRRHAIAELRNRIRAAESNIVAAQENLPMRYFKRKPGVPVGRLTQWARGLPGRLGADSEWQEITVDRFRYEIGRSFGSDGGSVERDLRLHPGKIAAAWDYELKCELVERETA